MSEIIHIADRFLIHFAAAQGIVLGVFFLLNWMRKHPKIGRWLPHNWQAMLAVSALAVFAVAALREPWDVHAGQWWGKAYFDTLSWLLGTGFAVWGIYRLIFMDWSHEDR